MTNYDKLILIAENQEKVYKAGQNSMISPESIIRTSASGRKQVVIEDVSETPHNVELFLSTCNAIPFPYYKESSFKNGIAYEVGPDKTITISGTATENTTFYVYSGENLCTLAPNTQYIFSGMDYVGNMESIFASIKLINSDWTTTYASQTLTGREEKFLYSNNLLIGY